MRTIWNADGVIFTSRDLTHLLETRLKLFRPAMFRKILRVDSSVPAHAERIELRTLEAFASFAPVNASGNHANLPMPTIDGSSATAKIYTFAAAYRIFDSEIRRAKALGMNLESTMSQANQTASEQLLESIAVTGGSASLGLQGIADVGEAATVASSAWSVDRSPREILADIANLIFAVYNNSKQNFTTDIVAMPVSKYQLISTQRMGDSSGDRTVLEAAKAAHPGVTFVPWYGLVTAGSGSTTLAVALDSKAPEGPRMVISEELTDHEPVREPLGFQVAQTLSTAGVVCEASEAVAYLRGL